MNRFAPLIVMVVFVASVLGLPLCSFAQPPQRGYTVAELVEQARHRNFKIRADAEKVYRARQQIKVAIGQLLPSLSLSNIIAVVKPDYYDLASSLLGFLFPSNWFRFKENKLFYQAERFTYATLIANEINGVESLAYRINSLKCLVHIYQFYLEKVRRLVMVAQQRLAVGEDTANISLEFTNIKVQMEHDLLILCNELVKQTAELAKAIALPPGAEWPTFSLADISLPHLPGIRPICFDDIIQQVMERSLERQALVYLVHAARYSTYDRAFQFLSPNGDPSGNFGFGYFAFVRIGKSRQRELTVKQEELEANLMTATRKAVSEHNIALELYQRSAEGYRNAEAWYNVIEQKFIEGGEYEQGQFFRALESLMGFHSRTVQAQHNYLLSRAQLDRLLLVAPYYADVFSLVPTGKPEKVPSNQEEGSSITRWWHKIKRKGENSSIQTAIDHKQLVLPN